MYFIW